MAAWHAALGFHDPDVDAWFIKGMVNSLKTTVLKNG